MSSCIQFFTENIQYTLRNKNLLRKWICAVILAERKSAGDINFVFCDDEFLTEYNVKYLNHNTLTDIITFPSGDDQEIIAGEIYISLPRVRENAVKFKVEFLNELHRVMVHGILHLLGYKDSSHGEKKQMRMKENFYLIKLSEFVL